MTPLQHTKPGILAQGNGACGSLDWFPQWYRLLSINSAKKTWNREMCIWSKRIIDLCEKYGDGVVRESMSRLLDQGEILPASASPNSKGFLGNVPPAAHSGDEYDYVVSGNIKCKIGIKSFQWKKVPQHLFRQEKNTVPSMTVITRQKLYGCLLRKN